ncbi:hypothetical protein C7U57_04280 [Pseudomonas sp. R9.37]|nr:hypothetical protein C7U57_04280 [Pseudomonas sp. R9.37]
MADTPHSRASPLPHFCSGSTLTVFSITAARARLFSQLSPYTSKLCRYVSHKNKIPVKSSAAS